MARPPAEHILENEIMSKVYFAILRNKKEGITGYDIGKAVYKDRYNLTKIYQSLKQLKKENLIEIKRVVKNGRKAKIIKPNLFNFLKVLSEKKLPEDYKLTEEELKTLADWFEKIDLSAVPMPEDRTVSHLSSLVPQKLSVLDVVGLIFKFGAVVVERFEKKNIDMHKKKKMFANTPIEKSLNFFEPFFDLPKTIREKIKHMELSTEVESLFNLVLTITPALA